jgi:hypothetical protein
VQDRRQQMMENRDRNEATTNHEMLRAKIESHAVIPFVGSCVSQRVKLKDKEDIQAFLSWKDLLLKAAEELEKKGKPSAEYKAGRLTIGRTLGERYASRSVRWGNGASQCKDDFFCNFVVVAVASP